MKKTFALLLALLMMVTLLTGCGGDNQTADGSGGRTDVKVPLASIGNTLDAHAWTLMVDWHVVAQAYESMYYVEDDASLSPRLAERHEISADGTEYTYYLRKGVKFHNGEEMKASDVVFSYQRCLDNSYRSSDIQGLEKVEALDDYTVKFTISAPSAAFLLSMNNIYVVSEKEVTQLGAGYGASAAKAGTGPYYLESYEQNSKIVMKAFSDYYRGEARIKTIEFIPMADSSTQLISFESGQFDICSIPAADWQMIVSSDKYHTEQAPSLHISYIGVNVSKKDSPLYDQRVRQAIGYCLDKEAMVEIAADGYADVANYMMRAGFFDGAMDTGVYFTRDLDKAKQLLTEAGYPDGFGPIQIQAITAANNRYVKIAEVLKENLAEIGIQSEIEQGETASMLPAWENDHAAATAYDIFVSGFSSSFTYFEFYNYVSGLEPAQVQFDENENIDTGYIQEQFHKGLIESDAAKRGEIFGEVDKYISQVAGYIPIMHVQNLYAWNKNLNATAPLRTFTVYDWSWN